LGDRDEINNKVQEVITRHFPEYKDLDTLDKVIADESDLLLASLLLEQSQEDDTTEQSGTQSVNYTYKELDVGSDGFTDTQHDFVTSHVDVVFPSSANRVPIQIAGVASPSPEKVLTYDAKDLPLAGIGLKTSNVRVKTKNEGAPTTVRVYLWK